MDLEFEGDWPTLFDAPSERLRSVFLGDPADPTGGIVELVEFTRSGPGPGAQGPSAPGQNPSAGFFLVSVYTDVAAALARLGDLGLGGEPRRITVHGVEMAVVRDPNGVRVELIGLPT